MADNDFGKKIEDFGQNIWKKAQSAVDIVSLNNDLSTKSRELSQVYAELGAACCKQQSAETEKNFPQLYEEARQLAAEIDALQEKVQRKKGVKKCPGCGELVSLGAAYCAKCGARVPDPAPEPEAEPDTGVYSGCGAPLDEDDAFCSQCGAKKN